MASTLISAKLPPDVDPTKAPIAFGRRALPKLSREIQSPELLTQQRALMALCDLVHDPENVYQAVQIGFLENLKTLLLHHDSTVRQKTTEILYIMAMHNVGRQGLIQNAVIPVLTELLDDPEDICRKNTHQVLDMMAKLPEGAVDILHAGLIPLLVVRLKTESDEIQELILGTLSNCLRMEASEALATDAITILKEKLTHPSATIRNKAAQVILEIGTHPEGKSTVCEEVIPLLVSLLEDTDPEVQASAAGALMFATIKPKGRCLALRAEAIPRLLKLVAVENSKARLSAIKTLTMLAEVAEGRRKLLERTDIFQQCLRDPSEAVKRAAEIAIRVIRWKPF
ncbi:radial spoke head 14 homolog isoform X1 [Gallus gallus]|uniref:Radial spoke head 14 homolog n=1 Tax=Gallus gallus TaxID=9031 RepID=A0A8V1ADH4_CHICK|nr:radial spoke head 14 homolog isoform X1 [Gallus gallus]XP_040540892.1 radial spoke head 14 homolog isoform X1 [Gallus gallus]XP_040540893.1 radial spoke head 14 homolog isoform X1 [Gallus gallus]XP_415246.2 radial spoke head 14 homolog isoform X1 [Gallus gallus]